TRFSRDWSSDVCSSDLGLITLWTPIKEVDEETDPDNWPTQAPQAQTQSAPRRVAERIAREIRGWLDDERPLGPRGRSVRADDIRSEERRVGTEGRARCG